MDIIEWKALDEGQRKATLLRPAQASEGKVSEIVSDIIKNIRERGDEALKEYSRTLDRCPDDKLELSADEIAKACSNIDPELKEAIDKAYVNIRKFHEAQQPCHATVETVPELSADEIAKACSNIDPELKEAIDKAYVNIRKFHEAQQPCHATVETVPGIVCKTATHPIEKVGLYVPGGSAPLVSTALMLGVPAEIAQCPEVILTSPYPLSDAIIYAASKCGISVLRLF